VDGARRAGVRGHYEPIMTVRQVLIALQALVAEDPAVADLPVETEGCDCDGDVARVVVKDKCVYLARPGYVYDKPDGAT
jgi:hypothetical protein